MAVLTPKQRLVYLMQTKLGVQLPGDLLHDIDCALADEKAMIARERDYWREMARPIKEAKRHPRG
ncbi:hypothetical protein HNP81_002851 [Peribacillus huizhouensis]|uniref:Fur-regulated basic protein FbpA n=1 Tax=Peribacillus huizhouensis TaxID=1501239 RepID=A0ABR6CS50_9BACI|nr:hypothetical protein [Peribacillus huizhouensis]